MVPVKVTGMDPDMVTVVGTVTVTGMEPEIVKLGFYYAC